MENLESHEIERWVMESHGKAIYFQRIKRQKVQKFKSNRQIRKPD